MPSSVRRCQKAARRALASCTIDRNLNIREGLAVSVQCAVCLNSTGPGDVLGLRSRSRVFSARKPVAQRHTGGAWRTVTIKRPAHSRLPLKNTAQCCLPARARRSDCPARLADVCRRRGSLRQGRQIHSDRRERTQTGARLDIASQKFPVPRPNPFTNLRVQFCGRLGRSSFPAAARQGRPAQYGTAGHFDISDDGVGVLRTCKPRRGCPRLADPGMRWIRVAAAASAVPVVPPNNRDRLAGLRRLRQAGAGIQIGAHSGCRQRRCPVILAAKSTPIPSGNSTFQSPARPSLHIRPGLPVHHVAAMRMMKKT